MTLAINDKPVLNLKAVVFATDFSLCSQNAGLYAARTAAYFSAKLLVTHAFTRSQAAMEVTRYREAAQQVNFYTALLTRVRALPGVEAAGFVRAVPGQGYWGDNGFSVVEHPPLPQGKAQFAIFRWADPGYFAAMGIPLLRGRRFDESQRLDHAREAVVSKSFC